ncbi:MAG: ATP-binding protein, partial [Fimbriimonadaceae bacterium]|nr:ATP-binding protein [Alphaproteobacteria bacterium]
MTDSDLDLSAGMTAEPIAEDNPENALGRIVSVNGSQAIILLAQAGPGSGKVNVNRTDMGTLLRIDTPYSMVLGLVSAQSVPAPNTGSDGTEIRIVELDLVGEIIKNEAGVATTFRRGVSHYPSLGDLVFSMTGALLKKAYTSNRDCIHIGSITQDENIPATVMIDELLGKHFAVLGTTGTGKSCAVALTLNSILDVSPNAHILLIDPHNEYA